MSFIVAVLLQIFFKRMQSTAPERPTCGKHGLWLYLAVAVDFIIFYFNLFLFPVPQPSGRQDINILS